MAITRRRCRNKASSFVTAALLPSGRSRLTKRVRRCDYLGADPPGVGFTRGEGNLAGGPINAAWLTDPAKALRLRDQETSGDAIAYEMRVNQGPVLQAGDDHAGAIAQSRAPSAGIGALSSAPYFRAAAFGISPPWLSSPNLLLGAMLRCVHQFALGYHRNHQTIR